MTPPLAAVITPYYKESPEVLERCMASVRAQTVPTLHILVADGHPQQIETGPRLRHLTLDQPENDAGNTPRAVGAAVAINTGVKLITMLDADNWFDPDHLETAFATATQSPQPPDIAFASRKFWRPDGTQMPLDDLPSARFVDANCYLMFERAFQHLSWWGTVPRPFATGADKLFRAYLGKHKDLATTDLPRPTVNYECLWAGAYRHIGETPPPGAKDLAGIDGANWIKNASPWEVAIAERRLGLTLKKPDDLA